MGAALNPDIFPEKNDPLKGCSRTPHRDTRDTLISQERALCSCGSSRGLSGAFARVLLVWESSRLPGALAWLSSAGSSAGGAHGFLVGD